MKLFLLIILLVNTASFTFAKETKMFCGAHHYKLNSSWFRKEVFVRDKGKWVGWCTEDRKPSGKLTVYKTAAECEREDGTFIVLDFKRKLRFPITPTAEGYRSASEYGFFKKSYICSRD